ncbi:hypothetical protein ACA910_003252 [Epithemia clementina (nom. ined.)]
MSKSESTMEETNHDSQSGSLSITEKTSLPVTGDRTTIFDEGDASPRSVGKQAMPEDVEDGGESTIMLSLSMATSSDITFLRTSQTPPSNAISSLSAPHRHAFVDYTPPPSQIVKPPAKYKLWLMVLTCVFFADWFSEEAKFVPWLQNNFRLSFNGALFVFLALMIATLVFAAFELLTCCVRFKYKGEWYGIEWWLKQPRIQWVHEHDNFPCELLAGLVVILEDGFAIFDAPRHTKAASPSPKLFYGTESDDEHEVILKIENRIKPGKDEEYLRWKDRLVKKGFLSRPGLLDVKSDVSLDSENGNLYTVYLTFTSIDFLNAFMASPVRARLVRNLQPLLSTPTSVQLQKKRVLPDAFTDLCAQQGRSAPKRTPKKWKVWWLTTVGLYFVVLVTNATLTQHYFEEWGLNDAHIRAQSAVRVIFNTWLNTYVLTPFMTLIFGHWLKRGANEHSVREPWRTLNDGFSSIYSKFAVFLLFYGGMAIASIVD